MNDEHKQLVPELFSHGAVGPNGDVVDFMAPEPGPARGGVVYSPTPPGPDWVQVGEGRHGGKKWMRK